MAPEDLRPKPQPKTKAWSSATEFLGLERDVAVLLMAIVVASTGERVWFAFIPKYLEVLGAGPGMIGLFDAVYVFLGAVYAYPGAWIADRFGQRSALLGFTLVALLGYLLLFFFPSVPMVVFGAFLYLAWSSFSLPVTFQVVATRLRAEKHTMGIGVQSLVRRIPIMIGPVIGGTLVARAGWREGIHQALAVCIGLSVLALVVQALLREEPRQKRVAPRESPLGFFGVLRAFPGDLRELLVSDILIRFCERIPYAFLLLWAVNHVGISADRYGLLVSIEMLTAIACYIPVAHLADRYGQRPFVFATFIFFTLFPLSLLFATSYPMLIFAFFLRGLKEFGEPSRKALIIKLSPAALQSRAYGVYYLVRDSIVTFGSFLGAWLWKISPQTNFATAAAFGAVGTVWFVWRWRVRGAATPS